MKRFGYIIGKILSFVLLGLILFGLFWVSRWIWRHFTALNPELAAALLTAFATVLGAAITITLGRIFEKRKDVEAHFREKKSEIYDEFLKAFYTLGDDAAKVDLVPFLREWQRKIILWGGPRVLISYFKWMNNLKLQRPDAESMFLMHDFFSELRKDLGLSNKGLERGAFIRLILQNADLFLIMAKQNPNVTLEEVSAKEKELE